MRRPSTPRKAARPLVKPTFFPAENVLERALPAELLGHKEFEGYHFLHFDFAHADLSNYRFSECLFTNCNFAGVILRNVGLQNVAFEGCKLLGAPFQTCRDLLFAVHFAHCQLDYASFEGRAMVNTQFVSCSLREADFSRADLSGAVLRECLLTRAVFHQTRLIGADFTTAQQITLDPELNEVQQARFALHSLPGLLTKYALVIE